MREVVESIPGATIALLWATSFLVPIIHPEADKLDVVLGLIVPMYGWCWLLFSAGGW